jgi:hypothetical protein
VKSIEGFLAKGRKGFRKGRKHFLLAHNPSRALREINRQVFSQRIAKVSQRAQILFIHLKPLVHAELMAGVF